MSANRIRSAPLAAVAAAWTLACWSGVPTAAADPHQGLTEVVTAARGSASCGPLRYDPRAEHAAEIVNRSTYQYLNHTAEHVPADDPHPAAIAADVGLTGTKVISLQGAGKNERDAIQALVIQGYQALPDCAYTDFGTSMLYEPESGYSLAVVVMAGP